jgi:hypothetical protein
MIVVHCRSAGMGVAVLCLVAVAGCTSGSGSGVTLQTPSTSTSSSHSGAVPTSSVPSSTAVSSSSSPTAVSSSSSPTAVSPHGGSATSTTAPPADQEAADRKAIETVWAAYWTTGSKAIGQPPADQKRLMSTVAVNPALQLVLDGYAKFAKNGWTDYGTVSHRPYWSTPVSGKSTVVMGDCMDDSKAGSMDIKTGKKLTVGVARDNTRVTLVKGTDSVWRVQKIEYLVKVPC